MKIYEHCARYLLGIIYLFGAIDGICFLFFGIYIHGKPNNLFLQTLQGETYFWAFMKLIQLLGALSLLTNYKPALGTALLTPISAVLCLFYLFDIGWYYAFTVVFILSIVLLRAYWESYKPLLKDYPMKKR